MLHLAVSNGCATIGHMLTPQNIEACCALAYWDHVSDAADGQVWVQDCPEHGQRVGSEYIVRYSQGNASSSEAAA